MTNVSCFFSEFLGAFVLMFVVLAIGDKKNCPVPAGLAPLALYFLILGLGASLGVETGEHCTPQRDLERPNQLIVSISAYAINPARDFGPRLLTAAAGYGSQVWNYRK